MKAANRAAQEVAMKALDGCNWESTASENSWVRGHQLRHKQGKARVGATDGGLYFYPAATNCGVPPALSMWTSTPEQLAALDAEW